MTTGRIQDLGLSKDLSPVVESRASVYENQTSVAVPIVEGRAAVIEARAAVIDNRSTVLVAPIVENRAVVNTGLFNTAVTTVSKGISLKRG